MPEESEGSGKPEMLPKKEFHEAMPRMSVTVGAAVRQEDRILFLRQTYGRLKDVWGFPSGFVKEGETPDRAALRELKEESGIQGELRGLLSASQIDWEGEPQLYLVFLIDYQGGKLSVDGVENDEAAFLSLEEIERFEEPMDLLCKWIARRVLSGECQFLPPRDTRPLDPHYWTTFM